jgi:hypothetical protein
MRASTAYFAGGGTVILAIVVGIGGGLIMGNMVAPQSPKQGAEQTRLERQKTPEPIQAAAGPSQPVPYLGTTQAVAAAPAPTLPQPETATPHPAPQVQTFAVAQPAATQQPAATPPTAPPQQPVTASAQPATPEPREPRAAAAEDTKPRARDREDTRRAVERRNPERRQQWVESRRRSRQQDLRAVEEAVREDTEGRPGRELRVESVRREFSSEPVRIETPQIRLFGTE